MTLYHPLPTTCNPWFPFLSFCLLCGRLGIQRTAFARGLSAKDVRFVPLGNMNISCVVSICYFDHLTHRCLQIFQIILWVLRLLTSTISWTWWLSSRNGYSTYLGPSSSWGCIYFSIATFIEVVVSSVIYHLELTAHWHYSRLRFSPSIASIVGKLRTPL